MNQPSLGFARDEALDVRPRVQAGSVTSARAAEHLKAEGKQGAKLQRLLRAYADAWQGGLTDGEAAHQTDLPRSSICSLRAAALEQGWIEKTATMRTGEFGHSQSVWRITAKGRTQCR